MNQASAASARGGGLQTRVSRGWRWHWLALGAIVLTMVLFIGLPSAMALRPAQVVTVAAALPVPDDPETSLSSPAADAPPRSVRTVQAPGWLEADPFATAVPSLTDGVVQAIHVLEGDAVRRGDLIARLVPDDAEIALRRAQAAVASAEAELQEARSEHAAAQAHWDQPVERDRQVAVASAALAEAEAELALLPARMQEAEAALRRWQQEQARVEEAYEQKAATERERLVTQYEAASRAAALAALEKQRPLLEAKVQRLRAEASAATRAADLRIDEQRALARAAAAVQRAQAQLSAAQAELAAAELRMQRMTVTSPLDGYVLRRVKRPGDKVMQGSDDPHSAHLVHLYDPQQMQVRVDVPLADAAQVSVGQRCEIVVDVLPDQTFAGEVTRITHEADLQKNTLQVKVRVLDPSPMLRPEMLARVRFAGSAEPAGNASDDDVAPAARVRVPADCVTNDRVWVVRQRRGPHGVANIATVRITAQGDDGLVTVEGPLHVGDLLVREPVDLDPGDRVQIASNPGGDA